VASRSSDLRRVLTFGGQVPLGVGSLVIAMAVATVAGTAWPALAGLLVLAGPGSDWVHLAEVWRLATWPLYQGRLPNSLLDLAFGGFMMVWLGRQLSYAWSERRFLLRVLLVTACAGLVTVLVLAALGQEHSSFGIWAVANALLVTWGLLFPGQRINWFGALEMRGATVAQVVTVATPLWAVVVGPPVAYVPHLAAVGVAWLLAAGGPRRGWSRMREWWLRLTLDRQRRKFKVISTDRPRPRSKEWMN